VFTIENKLSIGIIEKRQKYFKDADKQFDANKFVNENETLLLSFARILYQLQLYYKE